METRECSRCATTRPLGEFAQDARRKSGVRSICKACDRAARGARRRAGPAKPAAVILVPDFPALPDPPPEPAGRPEAGRRPASYVDEAERFLESLSPPVGPADALLVRSLRGIAELLDGSEHGLDRVKDTAALVPKMVALLRELKATRATKAEAPAKPAAGKLDGFRVGAG